MLSVVPPEMVAVLSSPWPAASQPEVPASGAGTRGGQSQRRCRGARRSAGGSLAGQGELPLSGKRGFAA